MPKRIYLDQNKWIDLSRAYHGRNDGGQFAEVLRLCFTRREQGAASFPFSAQHHMELSKRAEGGSRRRLAELIATLSNGETMRSYTAMVPELVARYCQRLGGHPEADPPAVFGRGFDFAFGKPTLPTEWQDVDPTLAAKIEADLSSAEVIADILSNPIEPDREKVAEVMHLHGSKVAEAAESMRTHTPPMPSELVDHALQMRIALSDQEDVVAACERLGADASLFLADIDSIRAGVAAIPPLRVELALMRDQVSQKQRKAHKNDMVDIATMSVVMPYCDVVVSERHWAHVCKQSGVAAEFDTVVLTDVNELANHL